MKKIVFSIVFCCVVLVSTVCHAAAGIVAYVNDAKDLIIVETNLGYTCGEIYAGLTPYEGDRVFGTMTSYGLYTWKVNSFDGFEISVFVDEFNCSEEEVFNWLRRQ